MIMDAESSLQDALSKIPIIEAQIKTILHRLAVLSGKNPTDLYEKLSVPAALPDISLPVIAKLPSDLLRKRPDLRQYEKQLVSQTALIGVSVAKLFPNFQLTGNVGLLSSHSSNLLSSGSRFWNYGSGFTIPIFDFGRIKAEIDAQYAIRNQALLNYKKIILSALEEVENALVNFSNEHNSHDNLCKQLTSKKTTYELSMSKYNAGLTDFLEVLQNRVALLTNELSELQSKTRIALYCVAIYKALGGGWEIYSNSKRES